MNPLVERARLDPAWWIKSFLNKVPWAIQREILEAVRDNSKVSVQSCHGAGKSFIAACIVLWFLLNYPGSRVITTAPTNRQVRAILWAEIRNLWYARLGGEVFQTELRLDEKWYAFGFSTDDSDAFQGHHATDLLVVFDEAAGIPAKIWDSSEGVLTSLNCKRLAIGNPTDITGRFYIECRNEYVKTIRISAFDTPNFTHFGITEEDIADGNWQYKIGDRPLPYPSLTTPYWVAERYREWGPDSPLYHARVLGQFPDQDEHSLIPLSAIEAAQHRSLEVPEGAPLILSADIARHGGDESVIGLRHGPVYRTIRTFSKQSTMLTAEHIAMEAKKYGVDTIKPDCVGVGAPVVDRLLQFNLPVWEMHPGSPATEPENFVHARDEWYWGMKERFEEGSIDIDPDDDVLAQQLLSITWASDGRGRIKVEGKDQMKGRGLKSPDRADAMMLSFAGPRYDALSLKSSTFRKNNLRVIQGGRGEDEHAEYSPFFTSEV